MEKWFSNFYYLKSSQIVTKKKNSNLRIQCYDSGSQIHNGLSVLSLDNIDNNEKKENLNAINLSNVYLLKQKKEN